jgi:hypothetical protein
VAQSWSRKGGSNSWQERFFKYSWELRPLYSAVLSGLHASAPARREAHAQVAGKDYFCCGGSSGLSDLLQYRWFYCGGLCAFQNISAESLNFGSRVICRFHHSITDAIFAVSPSPILKTGMTMLNCLLARFEPRLFVISTIPFRNRQLYPWPLLRMISRPCRTVLFCRFTIIGWSIDSRSTYTTAIRRCCWCENLRSVSVRPTPFELKSEADAQVGCPAQRRRKRRAESRTRLHDLP